MGHLLWEKKMFKNLRGIKQIILLVKLNTKEPWPQPIFEIKQQKRRKRKRRTHEAKHRFMEQSCDAEKMMMRSVWNLRCP